MLSAKKRVEKERIREAKKKDKQLKEESQSLPQLKANAQKVANKYARMRDLLAGKGCISCGRIPQQKRGGTMDGGHYRSVGSAPHLRFFLPNINLQCVHCNKNLSGNVVEARKALVAQRGAEWVDWLDSLWFDLKPSKDYLRRYTQVIGKRANRMEKLLKKRGEL